MEQCEFSEGEKAFLAWIKANYRVGLQAACVTVKAASESQGSWLQGCSRNWNRFLMNQEPSREVKKTKWDFYFFSGPPSFLGDGVGGEKKEKKRKKKYKLLQFSPKPGEGSRGQGAWGPPPEELLDDAVSKIFSARRTLTFSPFTLQGIFSCDSGNFMLLRVVPLVLWEL